MDMDLFDLYYKILKWGAIAAIIVAGLVGIGIGFAVAYFIN